MSDVDKGVVAELFKIIGMPTNPLCYETAGQIYKAVLRAYFAGISDAKNDTLLSQNIPILKVLERNYKNMLHDEIVNFEVAKLAKEKGFNEKCYHYYQNGVLESDECFNRYNKGVDSVCSAPTQSLLQRWLREEKGIIVEVFMDDDSNMPLTYNIHQYKDWNWECVCHHHDNYYAVNDWELCLEDALKYALENLL